MPRPKGPLATPLPLPHTIDPNAVYNVEAAQRCLHLRKETIRLEVKAGRLWDVLWRAIRWPETFL
jgi:hypothetical protein